MATSSMTAGLHQHNTSGIRVWLVLAVILAGCRDRPRQTRSIDWQAGTAENAALLILDAQSTATLACLPRQAPARPLFAPALRQILDVAWQGGPLLAGFVSGSETPPSNELVLLSSQAEPRRLGRDVLTARFSPDGSALAYQVRNAVSSQPPETMVFDLTTARIMQLAGVFDPRWESDSMHIRGTLVQRAADGSSRWLRARWDRQRESLTLLGPGSAQIPAPIGAAVAWSSDQANENPGSSCLVRLGPPGGGQIPHKVQGEFCLGVPDDRSLRWSPDGQWLAFPHPGPVPGGRDPNKSFLDVVAIAGGRSRALMDLHAQVGPTASEIAVSPASVWIDWNPSQRFLAVADGAGDLRVYDFEVQGIAALGKADRPQWSPGGAYLLIRSKGEDGVLHFFVLPGVAPSARIDLGPVRDARWLPAQACDGVAAPEPS